MKIKRRFSDLAGYKKINFIIIGISLLMFFCISVGYSVLQQRLDINANLTLRVDKDIRVTNISSPIITNGAYEIYNSRYNVDSITNNIALPNIDSTISYDVTITNAGNVPMQVKSITNSVFNNDNITYTLNNIEEDTVIAKEDDLIFTITFKYKNNISVVPTPNTLGSIIEFEFIEYIPEEIPNYISDGLILKLEGTNRPQDNKWIDTENNKEVTLSNVTYDATDYSYNFNSTGHGNLGEVIIPATGDFTLETLITTPASHGTTEDQAIVSQVNNSSNDSGRFKFNFKVDNSVAKLLVFVNRSTSSSISYDLATVNKDVQYLIQAVRSNGKLDLYLNSNKISSNTFDSGNAISQTNFKLGRWNNSSNQQYKGKIHAVRVYDKALTHDEIINNFEVDQKTYNTKERTIKEYAVETSLTSSGEGLYQDGDGYRYRGTTLNNYMKFPGDSDVYRIVNFENDDTMKVLNTSRSYNIAFDNSGNRSATTSKYCTHASTHPSGENILFYGCNYFKATPSVIGNSDDNVLVDASIKDYMNTTFYNSLASTIKSKIVTHSFPCGLSASNVSPNAMVSQINSDFWSGKVGLLTMKDAAYSIVSLPATLGETITANSYLIALTTNTTLIWTMNGYKGNTWDIWTITRGNSISKRRASRTYQTDSSNNTYLYYAYPAFYISSNYKFSGTGIKNDPIIIKEDE